MKKNNLLQRFEYTAVPAASYVSMIEKKTDPVAIDTPLMMVVIDFEKGKFCIEGDWQFLMAPNRHASPASFFFHNGRIGIEADICPAGIINLDDCSNDGQIWPVEGFIKDRGNRTRCYGFIVLDKITEPSASISEAWDISFYLYDYQADDCEIMYRLPVYKMNDNKNSN